MSLIPVQLVNNEENATVSRPQVFVMIGDTILEGVYRSRLQVAHYCTVWCEKGDGWKTSLLSFSYDVLVVDLSLFPSDPIGNLLALKKLAPDAEIIVLTESEDVRIAISAFRMGIAEYFLKPTDPETLAWAIEKILRRKELKTSHEALNKDLAVFSVAHHINMSESDFKMRNLAMKYLIPLFRAEGGIWIWPGKASADGVQDLLSPFRTEGHQTGAATAERSMNEFRSQFPKLLEESFDVDSRITSHPEQWFRENFIWIPLRCDWMGGILLFGVNHMRDAVTQARLEFLVRNVELSLENYRRYGEVKQLTYIDDLTGLYNQRYLEIAVTAACEDYRRTNQGFSILFIDIDKFKTVNDGHGHQVGSAMLVELATYLKNTLRKPDHLFRYGGDEFIALLYDVDAKKAFDIAERLRSDVEKKIFYIHGKEYKITLSIGVARFPDHGKDKHEIIKMADDAMYNGKKSGRNRVFLAAEIGASSKPQKAAA